ncbi:MAG: DUF2490 domain-containing protein [Spirosomaceae bacterium]|jgi:hypothetical protein|nr:DUF2490 domain-containing protein [Spirosomataceae bacterium]
MQFIHLKKFRLVILLFIVFDSIGQNIRVVAPANHAWYTTNGITKINKKFGFFHDFQFRRADLAPQSQQYLFRGALVYNANDKVQLFGGYAFVRTFPYGDFPVKTDFDEHRLWEQIQIKQSLGKFTYINRFRLEQRFLGDSNIGGFQNHRFENRIRYMARLNYPFTVKLYGYVYDEIFMNFGRKVTNNDFDQNRLGAMLGYKITPKISLEAGYLNQFVKQRRRTTTFQNIYENNHTLMVSAVTSF